MSIAVDRWYDQASMRTGETRRRMSSCPMRFISIFVGVIIGTIYFESLQLVGKRVKFA